MGIKTAKINLFVFCLVTLINASGFGFFYGNTRTFANYYNVSIDYINSIFYVGLITELIFFFPAIKIIEWRLDYSIMAGAFLTVTSYMIQFIAQTSFFVSKIFDNISYCFNFFIRYGTGTSFASQSILC